MKNLILLFMPLFTFGQYSLKYDYYKSVTKNGEDTSLIMKVDYAGNTSMDDTISFYDGSKLLFKSHCPISYNGADTIFQFQTKNTPCQDSVVTVRYYLNLLFGDSVLDFYDIGIVDKCKPLNDLFGYYWVHPRFRFSPDFFNEDPKEGELTSIEFYPNPTSGKINVSGTFELYELNGSLIFKGEGKEDISHLKTGVYIIRQSQHSRLLYRR